jgi:DNA-directed RNA polymerase specialized sigma24 family protein
MKVDQSSPVGGANQFQSTRWSVVLVSPRSQATGSKEAFADLCKLYWYPLDAFIRHRGYSPEDAEDLVQGFFLHLVEHKTLRRVDRSKDKFRSFLLASLQNYLSDEADRARRALRQPPEGAFQRVASPWALPQLGRGRVAWAGRDAFQESRRTCRPRLRCAER